jgi:hypothetical protein
VRARPDDPQARVFHVILDAAGGVAKEFVVVDDTVTAADKKASPVLTVWRRLHVEVDSMGAVAGNTVTGQITNVVDNGNGTSTRTTNYDLGADSVNRFVPGTFTDSAGNAFILNARKFVLFEVTHGVCSSPIYRAF